MNETTRILYVSILNNSFCIILNININYIYIYLSFYIILLIHMLTYLIHIFYNNYNEFIIKNGIKIIIYWIGNDFVKNK